MKEVKSPKKPLIYYYGIVLLILFLFNLLVTPLLAQRQVQEVDYGTFMDMIEDKNIGEVEVTESQIVFTDKDNTSIYKTCLLYTSHRMGWTLTICMTETRQPSIRLTVCLARWIQWKKC